MRYIDMENYPRREHFDYFRAMGYPYVGLTAEVDVTELVRAVKDAELPLFLSLLWHVSGAANAVPEFRQRILGDAIAEFEHCSTSHTVDRGDGTYCYCTLDCSAPFADFLPDAVRAQDAARLSGGISEDASDSLSLFFISTLPWLSYTALVQPVPCPADSNPRITWGRYFERDGRLLLPVSVLCHHAIIDGVHISGFYEQLQASLESPFQA